MGIRIPIIGESGAGPALMVCVVVALCILYVVAPYSNPKAARASTAVTGPAAVAAETAVSAPAKADPGGRLRTAPSTMDYLFYFSGLVAFGLMSVAVVLAARPTWLERWFGGLDGMYLAHKWAGIAIFVSIWGHYLLEDRKDGPPNPNRVEHPVFLADGTVDPSRLAAVVGEYAFYTLIGLVALSLLKRIPYRYWRWTHRAMLVLFPAVVLHIFLIKTTFPKVGALNLGLVVLAAGGVAAILYQAILRHVFGRRTVCRVKSVAAFPRGTELLLEPLQGPLRFVAGQFVFLKLHVAGMGEAHPFTLSAAPGEPCLRLSIRALGDYTARLADVPEGALATIRGPYGRFDHRIGGPRQVWVAGGIGITPFLSWLGDLARGSGAAGPEISLFYCVRYAHEAVYLEEIRARCAMMHRVSFTLIAADVEGFLDFDCVLKTTGWAADSMDVLFCGPTVFGNALLSQARLRGLPRHRFHRERFEIR